MPSSPTTSDPAGLPVPLTPLLGREREAAAISAVLRRGDGRLRTLTGQGNAGETRFATGRRAEGRVRSARA